MADNGADPDCTLCGGLGYFSANVPIGHVLFGTLIPCDCTAGYRAGLLQKMSGLTGEEQRVTLKDIIEVGTDTCSMIGVASAFIAQPSGMVTLWGGSGNAKSLILQAVVNECIGQGIVAVYVTMLDLLEYIREAYNGKADESAWRRMERYEAVPVLAIDEVDKVKASDWVVERESAIFEKRYRWGLARRAGTLLAMNANPDRLPDWIQSRLSDGRNRIIENRDPDMRRLMK